MVTLKYIETVKMGGKAPRALFILSDEEKIKNSKIAIFGTGIEAYLTYMYMSNIGIEVSCFLNNDSKLEHRKFCGREILRPFNVISQDYYIIISVGELKFYNEILWQLKAYHNNNYAVVFIDSFHDFSGTSQNLQNAVMEEINRILCNGKSMEEIVAPSINVGNSLKIFKEINELCWTTTWSNQLIAWMFEKYRYEGMPQNEIKLLEIGPGKGLFSAMVHNINAKIDINWLMFEMEEESNIAVKDRYTWYPANLFKTYYGKIEKPEYSIDDKYDIIIMTEVFEHFVLNPIPTMKKIASFLKEDGEIYFSTPNWGHLPIYESYRDMPLSLEEEDYKDMYIGHSYQYNRQELESIFDECGLYIEKYGLSDSNNHNAILKHKN